MYNVVLAMGIALGYNKLPYKTNYPGKYNYESQSYLDMAWVFN